MERIVLRIMEKQKCSLDELTELSRLRKPITYLVGFIQLYKSKGIK